MDVLRKSCFRPNDKLTRVQALVGLVNGLGLVGGKLNILGYYGDRAQIPSYATDEVATATEKKSWSTIPT